MNKRLTTYLPLAFALALSACGGSPTGTNSGDPLTAVEIEQVLAVLSESFGDIGVGPSFALNQKSITGQDAVALRAIPINADFNESVGCPSGGTISLQGSVDGDIDDETFVGNIAVEFRWDFNSCAVTTQTTTVTLNGDPHIEFKGDFEFTETTFAVSGTEKGGFSYTAADGRAGSCGIDVTFNSTVNTGTNSASSSFSGSICGQSANQFGG